MITLYLQIFFSYFLDIIALCVGLAFLIFAIVFISVLICHYRNKDTEKLITPNDGDSDLNTPYGTVQAWFPEYRNDNTKFINNDAI